MQASKVLITAPYKIKDYCAEKNLVLTPSLPILTLIFRKHFGHLPS